MFILYMETLNKVELMVGSSSKLSKKFIIGLEKLGLTLKEVMRVVLKPDIFHIIFLNLDMEMCLL